MAYHLGVTQYDVITGHRRHVRRRLITLQIPRETGRLRGRQQVRGRGHTCQSNTYIVHSLA